MGRNLHSPAFEPPPTHTYTDGGKNGSRMRRCRGESSLRRPKLPRDNQGETAASIRMRCAGAGRTEVCLAWALDWRCKSFAGRVGSNREPEATARSWRRRETTTCWRREAVWGRSPRQTAAPNESELLSKPDRPGKRVFEREAQNPTEAEAVSARPRISESHWAGFLLVAGFPRESRAYIVLA